MSRRVDADGHALRARVEIDRLRASIDGLEIGLRSPGRSGEAARAVADTAMRLVAIVAALDVLREVESDDSARARGGEHG